ncbi:MAG: hypothetical protein QOH36_1546 [Actinomycetota bacterium]|nr:hypothetical protein [Actinomycetota bacterium]
MAVEDDVDALYAADPDGFVAARQALAKRLKAEGDKAGAAEVAALRRPTAAAWAVNQLARRHGGEVAGLVARGDDLRRAHERLLAGGRDDDTVAAGRRRREAIADLVDQAAAILTESGRAADAHRDAISATLDAASLDQAAGAEVVAGRLSKELEPPSGFGELDWSAAPAPARRPPPAKAPPVGRKEKSNAGPAPADDGAEPAAAERARRADEARQRATMARTAAARARALADQARDAADQADAERERLEEEVIRARKTAVDSRRTARELRDAAQEAERQATALEAAAGP